MLPMAGRERADRHGDQGCLSIGRVIDTLAGVRAKDLQGARDIDLRRSPAASLAESLRKRQVKMPKVYLSDSGLLHTHKGRRGDAPGRLLTPYVLDGILVP